MFVGLSSLVVGELVGDSLSRSLAGDLVGDLVGDSPGSCLADFNLDPTIRKHHQSESQALGKLNAKQTNPCDYLLTLDQDNEEWDFLQDDESGKGSCVSACVP